MRQEINLDSLELAEVSIVRQFKGMRYFLRGAETDGSCYSYNFLVFNTTFLHCISIDCILLKQ